MIVATPAARLETTTETEHCETGRLAHGPPRRCVSTRLTKVKSRLLLDIIVGKSAAILELLAGKDEALLVRRDTLLVLNLALDIVDGVGRLDLERDCLSGQGLDKDLHTSSQSENEVESGLLLDVCLSAEDIGYIS